MTATAGPSPINTQFDDQAVLATLPDTELTVSKIPSDPELLAERLQTQIQQARRTGDPRFLGYAEGTLQQWKAPLTERLRVLKATIDQSNHRFDEARAELNLVLQNDVDKAQTEQALLMLASIDLVQGNYDAAIQHCESLAQRRVGLIAASCRAQTLARSGQPETAYQTLKQQVAQSRSAALTARLWAEGTLGDIAAQLGQASAESHWLRVLEADPEDLYIRAQLADWYLSQRQPLRTLELTQGYSQVDSLAVLRAIALDQTNDPEAERLAQALTQRFAEAQWRGNLLHKREFARYQLDVAGHAHRALETARANWTDQREPADTRLLIRSAIAAGDTDRLETLRQWLAKNNQQDDRYPEITL